MRLWSLHPQYLDSQGLVALWREALLAQAVLRGETRGYQHHPQLDRFRDSDAAVSAITAYLRAVHDEAGKRGYAFDITKIPKIRATLKAAPIAVTSGQVEYEWRHLMAKLAVRNPKLHAKWRATKSPECHPLFKVEPGDKAEWERP